MKNIKLNLLIIEIDKKIYNLKYRIEGTLQRNRIQNIKYDSNLENLISIHDLLIEVRKSLFIQVREERVIYDLSYVKNMFANFRIFRD